MACAVQRRRFSVGANPAQRCCTGRPARQAVVEVEEVLFRSHPDVVDADLSDYFGSIPHAELLKSVARRVVNRRVLYLIKQWLECSVEETDGRGRKLSQQRRLAR